MNATKVVILCGGQGTRIRDVSEVLPKTMLPIGGRPIVWHIMKHYARHGFREFVLCLGHKGWSVKEFFLNYRAMTSDLVVELARSDVHALAEAPEDWRVTLAETGEHTMTGGRIAAVRRYVEGDAPFCVTYGDGVSNVDLTALMAAHRAHGAIATVTAVHAPARFGEMTVDGERVSEFKEKPQVTQGFINGGFMALDGRRAWSYIGDDPGTHFEREPLQRLANDGELRAFAHEGFWQPMDTLREYRLLNDLWAEGRAPWKTWDAP